MSNLLTASARLRSSSAMSLKLAFPASTAFQQKKSWSPKTSKCILSIKTNSVYRNLGRKPICAINMTDEESGEPMKAKLKHVIQKARSVWDSSPQPVKSFPWNKVAESFILLILDLILAVIKYLSVPVLAVSSLSEMSYCAHEKKLFLIPIPILLGVALAGILKESALELSPLLKDAKVPWHLFTVAIFFTLIRLPGPYYPYWGRIFIPHLANGGLLRTLWFTFMWYRRPTKTAAVQKSIDDKYPTENVV